MVRGTCMYVMYDVCVHSYATQRTLKGTCQLLLLTMLPVTVKHSFKRFKRTCTTVDVEVEGSIQFTHQHSMVNQ